jgi:hypothetical protein
LRPGISGDASNSSVFVEGPAVPTVLDTLTTRAPERANFRASWPFSSAVGNHSALARSQPRASAHHHASDAAHTSAAISVR